MTYHTLFGSGARALRRKRRYMSHSSQPLNQGDRIYYRYGKHHQHLRNCVGVVVQVTKEGKVVATFQTDSGTEHYIIDRDQATKTI